MNKYMLFRIVLLLVMLLAFPAVIFSVTTETASPVSPEKKSVLDYLEKPWTIEKYGRISDSIWSYAELGLEEFSSVSLLSETLGDAGFIVEMGLAGMPTCFVATYGSGKPVIGILVEYDALPMISQKGRVPYREPLVDGGPGHGCGHNMMGTASIAAAIAVKQSMENHKIKGTIKVFGSPAEENLISRPFMIRAGLFDDVDAVIDNHSSSGFSTSYGVSGSALISTIFTFKGVTAHSGGSPWNGRSALDAVEIMNVATNYLREHLHYSHRMHYVILEGGQVPNVVPDKASVWYYVRNSDERIEEMQERVVNCAKAAALATGTELEAVKVIGAIHQRHFNQSLAELFQRNIELVGMPQWDEEDQEFARQLQKNIGSQETGMPETVDSLSPPGIFVGGGSSDVGDVTLIAPTATIRFPGVVPGAVSHHWSTVSSTYGSTAWKGLNVGAKAIAASAIDLLTIPGELEKAKKEFEEYSAKNPYRSFLPDDAEPYLELNRQQMEKYRPMLRQFYLE